MDDDDAAIARSVALHGRARAFVAAFEAGGPPPESFDALACDVARFQAERVPGFAKLLAARGVDAARFARASDVPAVPTDAFKHARVSAFRPEATPTTFRTSGTTIGARGEHSFRDTGTYDVGAVAFGRRALLRGELAGRGRVPVLVLGPSPEAAPDSSLTHMLVRFVDAFGEVERPWFVEEGVIDLGRLDEIVARLSVAEGSSGVLLCGATFAFVHFLDALGDAPFRLPEGSRVMQTGGFKGKSREVDGATLRRDLGRALRVPERDVVGEYGMTELSSQFYEREGGGPYEEPPWARVVPVDPETLEPVAEGEPGIARIEDLLNVDSAFAVLTADRVRRVAGGFELLGRAPGAPPRGCSIALDEMLS